MTNRHCSLKVYNTLGLDISTRFLIIAETKETILEAWKFSKCFKLPFLILGEASNVLFVENFAGIIVLNRIKGIVIHEDDRTWKLHIGSGENWHQLVQDTLTKGIFGLENLAWIPGTVGSVPIQNIGAYGVELQDFCSYVDVIHLESGDIKRIYNNECNFSYRDSIFKNKYWTDFVIIAVGIYLKKKWQPILTYNDLKYLKPVSAWDIFNEIFLIRKRKIPDPKIIGNVGSFFKNPIVTQKQAALLLKHFPTMPYYPFINNQIKLAAGWLIDQCNLKEFYVGDSALYHKQALVLINKGHATSQDILSLAKEIRLRVGKKFNIWLEPEVRFIKSKGECNAIEMIS
ncbi:UDP-N-acetylenolpyruvoylglucosamine reductase [Candidatus Pantoea edessiphila]|uniref:UDP-N-acetylenolpyruvoylglucosamine reductase n=1 Tax=Candidatus Pantoea edessiphila TaxID=2044610 RepID=A0A2P5SZ37_9GAMM|nr:UDP-N-acetylmuramate dehydrogenase [Candidatus Pantoea edessiphila]MBK4775554.1 UDP-N-acetylmuramate dehydrogenase [Pantoea sp. Edef]PPI87599.1 UDP-N-acetylenolpyruvoylglucosamine reductase [Candidatus Pantoea edessiphila]